MEATNPNPRHVEILAEVLKVESKDSNFTRDDIFNHLWSEIISSKESTNYIIHVALTAIHRAVEEATTPKNESELLAFMLVNIQRMSDEKREFFIKDLFARYPELNPLRTELERVRGEYKIQRLTHQLFCGKVADQLGFERTSSLMKQSKEEITCGTEGGGDV